MSDRDDDLKNPYYVRMMEGARGRFARYFVERTYDSGMASALGTLEGRWKAPSLQELQAKCASLSREQRQVVIEVVQDALIAAAHGFLHGLSQDEDLIQLLFEGEDMAAESDGLQGDFFWWLRDLSRYPLDRLD